ncbi:MAG: 6-phosphogluconolactonase [Gemmatimonadales bacterium]
MTEIFPTPGALADAVARHVVARAAGAIAATGRFILALAGGSTPREVYALLATQAFASQIEWEMVHVFWGDERCVPPGDRRSNYRMAKETLLDRVPIPAHQIHRMRGEDDPKQAAAQYEHELRALLGGDRAEGPPTAGLDLALLGMGEDGHTASLFAGQAAIHETVRWVVAVYVPVATMWRITLTPPVLNAASDVTFVVSGASKAARLQEVLQGPFAPNTLPAQAIRPAQGRLNWMVDQAAAGRLRPEQAPGRTELGHHAVDA